MASHVHAHRARAARASDGGYHHAVQFHTEFVIRPGEVELPLAAKISRGEAQVAQRLGQQIAHDLVRELLLERVGLECWHVGLLVRGRSLVEWAGHMIRVLVAGLTER